MAWFKAGVMGSPEVWIGDEEWQVKTSAVRALKKALIYRKLRVVHSPFSHHKCKRMMQDFVLLMSGLAVRTKNAVMPSRGVAVEECIVVLVPPLISSEEKRRGEVVDAQASETAKYLSHWFDNALWWHAEMQHGGAVEKKRGIKHRGVLPTAFAGGHAGVCV